MYAGPRVGITCSLIRAEIKRCHGLVIIVIITNMLILVATLAVNFPQIYVRTYVSMKIIISLITNIIEVRLKLEVG